MKGDRAYLVHILESISRIEAFTTGGRAAFLQDLMVQDAVLRNLQTLAESTQRLSEWIKLQNPQVRWAGVAGFRNVLVHDYLGVDLEEVWGIIETHLPELKQQIQQVLNGLS